MNTILERQSPRAVCAPDNIEAMARQANEKLKYTGLKQAVTRLQGDSRLLAAMAELNIQPFKPAGVERYKRQMRRRLWAHRPLAAAGVSLIACSVAAMMLVTANVLWLGLDPAAFTTFFLLVPGTMWGIGIVCASWDTTVWRRDALAGHPGFVPEYAIQSALDIQERVPEAIFTVDELGIERRPTSDPFLCVQVGDGPVHYIEVWDEPTFDWLRASEGEKTP